MHIHLSSVSFVRWGGLVLAAALAGPAHADLAAPVQLTLFAPGGVVGNPELVQEVADIDPATGLHAGDTGNQISEFWMLPGESVTFAGNSISLHLLAGANDPSNNSYVTGYLGQGGVPASYIFRGLQVPGFTITGVSATHLGGVFDSGVQVQLIGGAQLHFRLDSLLFDTAQNLRDGNGYYYADFRLDLSTQPVPEPAVWALSLLGLAALQLVTHRRRA
jgi:hypothetical protein